MYKTCPKCGHERGPADTGDAGVCPACGLVFSKWAQRILGTQPARAQATGAEDAGESGPTLFARLIYVEPRTDAILFWGRVALYVAFFVWGWYFILLDLRLIEHDHQIAAAADALGTILVLVALYWGGYILYCQYRNLPGKA